MTWLRRSGRAAWGCLPDSCQLHWQAARGGCTWKPHPPVSALFRQQILWNSHTAERNQLREQALLTNPRAGSRRLRQQALRSSRREGLQSQGGLPRGQQQQCRQVTSRRRHCRHPHPRHLLLVQHVLGRGTATVQPPMQRAAALWESSQCGSYAQQPGLPSLAGPCE